jgi:hypothetical protein
VSSSVAFFRHFKKEEKAGTEFPMLRLQRQRKKKKKV